MQQSPSRIPVVAPTGALVLATSRGLSSELAEIAGRPGDAVLDLTEVDFIDSMGLGVVLKATSRFSRQGKQLHLVVAPGGNVARMLELTGTTGRVSAVATRDEALARARAAR